MVKNFNVELKLNSLNASHQKIVISHDAVGQANRKNIGLILYRFVN